jgi:hypothetical protein
MESLRVWRWVFRRRQDGDKDGTQKRCCTKLEGVERCQRYAIGGAPGDVQPFAQDVGKNIRQCCANADEKALRDEAQRTLFVVQPVGDKGPKRLHADVDAAVEHPEQRCRNPQRRSMGHGKQRQAGQDRPGQKVGPAAVQARPCPVTQRADDGLDDETRHRRGQPEQRNLVRLCAKFFVDGAHIGHLQAPAELDAQKAEIHGEDVAERATARRNGRWIGIHRSFVFWRQESALDYGLAVTRGFGHIPAIQPNSRSENREISFFTFQSVGS